MDVVTSEEQLTDWIENSNGGQGPAPVFSVGRSEFDAAADGGRPVVAGGYPVAWLDTTRFGNASRFTARVPFELRLAAGGLVWVADDSVDPYLCRVVEVFDGGRSARYEVVGHGGVDDAGRRTDQDC